MAETHLVLQHVSLADVSPTDPLRFQHLASVQQASLFCPSVIPYAFCSSVIPYDFSTSPSSSRSPSLPHLPLCLLHSAWQPLTACSQHSYTIMKRLGFGVSAQASVMMV